MISIRTIYRLLFFFILVYCFKPATSAAFFPQQKDSTHKRTKFNPTAHDTANYTDSQRALTMKVIQRMNRDKEKYSSEQIMEGERMYQFANKMKMAPVSKDTLLKLVEKYPDMNRTGCAILYLATMSYGVEKEKWLQDAIDKHNDCYFGDGAQVGALARFQLAYIYKDQGDMQKARALFRQIRSEYPEAVDHRGRLLISQVPAE